MKEIFGKPLEELSGGVVLEDVQILDPNGNVIRTFPPNQEIVTEKDCPEFGPGCTIKIPNGVFFIEITYDYIKKWNEQKKIAADKNSSRKSSAGSKKNKAI